MARVPQTNELVFFTVAAMAGVTLIEGGMKVDKHGNPIVSAAKSTGSTAKQLLAIGLLWIIMAFVADQAPEFGGPFALLVLVAFLTLKTPVIKSYFNQATGSTK